MTSRRGREWNDQQNFPWNRMKSRPFTKLTMSVSGRSTRQKMWKCYRCVHSAGGDVNYMVYVSWWTPGASCTGICSKYFLGNNFRRLLPLVVFRKIVSYSQYMQKHDFFVFYCFILVFSLLSFQTIWNLHHSNQCVNKILVWTQYTILNKTTDGKKEKLILLIVVSILIEIKMWWLNIKDRRTVFVWHNCIMIGGHVLKVKMYPPQFFSRHL